MWGQVLGCQLILQHRAFLSQSAFHDVFDSQGLRARQQSGCLKFLVDALSGAFNCDALNAGTSQGQYLGILPMIKRLG